MSKKLKIVIGVIVLIIVLSLIFIVFIDKKEETQRIDILKQEENNQIDNKKEENNTFRAIVRKSILEYIEVEPIEESDKKILGDRVSIGLKDNSDMLYMEGTEIFITYTGEVKESYPTQIEATKIQTEKEYYTKIEELPQNYSVEQAIKDNCIVGIHNMKIYNKDELDRFVENVNNNIPDFIRTINFSDEGDMLINDIDFEGSNSFRVCLDWTRDRYSSSENRTYKYLRYTKMRIDQKDGETRIYLEDPIEGDVNTAYVIGYNENTEIIN